MKTALRILPFFLLSAGMFYYPQEVLTSALTGLNLWYNYILPALFPFFIVSELLMKQGFVHFLGALLEPLMRPLFRLPGKASFVLAMTHTSGIPIGAVLTSRMRKEGEITKTEGERLLAFTCNPSPGYMFGAVASGMLGNPSLGIIIAGSVYIANLIVGLIFRFYGPVPQNPVKHSVSLRHAWQELKKAQLKNKKPIGEMLGEAVKESTITILLVGGFIVFFCVIIHMMTIWHVTSILSKIINAVTGNLLSIDGAKALVEGLLETTLGCQEAISAYPSLNLKIGMLTFFMGWGGIAVFAQVASFTSSTDLRFFPFLLGRTLHAFLALIVSQIMLLFSDVPTAALPGSLTEGKKLWLLTLRWSSLYFIGTIALLISLYLFYKLFRKTRILV